MTSVCQRRRKVITPTGKRRKPTKGCSQKPPPTRYIAEHYYGADTEEKRANLSEHDKQELSLLGTLAAGLAGGGQETAHHQRVPVHRPVRMRLRITR